MVEHARAVVIGGGVGGTSIAYHLTELGWTDVVLVERAELTCGSTFHSAGLVGQLRSSVDPDQDDDVRHRAVPPTGGRDRDVDPSWHEVGSLRLASTPGAARGAPPSGRLGEDVRAADRADHGQGGAGPVPAHVDRRGPRRCWLPTDGWLDPSGLANALAAGARAAASGSERRRGSSRSASDRGRVTGVTVEHGGERPEIRGRGGRQRRRHVRAEIGRLAGVTVPIIPMAHQYLFTEPIEGVHPGLPQLRDPDNLVYFREEVGGLCMGGYERDPAPWSLDGIPADFNGKLLAPTWDRFESIMEGAIRRVPAMADAGVSRVINGPEAFTPDNEYILGESGGWRVLRRRRVLCARDRGCRRRRGEGVAEWMVGGGRRSTCGRWTSGASARPPVPATTAARIRRGVLDVLRHRLPEPGGRRRSAVAAVTGPRPHGAGGRGSGRSRVGNG